MKDRTETKSVSDSAKSEDARKILVAYASQFGSTGGVAEAIAEVLRGGGATVEAKQIENVKDLNAYDAVIIGSAIQYDRWMPEAAEFVTVNQDILSKLPVAFFFTCLTLSRQTEKSRRQAMAYADKISTSFSRVKPLDVGRFAGALNYSKMSFFSRSLAKILMTILRVPEGDYRDWHAIRSWAKDIGSKLSGGRALLSAST